MVVELMDKLHLDLTFQSRALVGRSNISITLHPNQPEFYMEVTDSFTLKCEIIEPHLYVHRAKLTPSCFKAISEHGLARAPAKYLISRNEVKHISLDQGVHDRQIDNICHGQLPRRIMIMMVASDAFNGSVKKDPFKFDHYKVNRLTCYINGQSYPAHGMQPDFDKNIYLKEFNALYQALNQNGTDNLIEIDRTKFKDEYPIFVFNFTPDLSSGPGADGHVNLIKRGELRIHIKFAEALKEPVTLLMFSEYDSLIQIDGEGTVRTSYT